MTTRKGSGPSLPSNIDSFEPELSIAGNRSDLVARIERLRAALEALHLDDEDWELIELGRAEKKNFAQRFSNALAQKTANALRRRFKGIFPDEAGRGHESRSAGAGGLKKLDVNYSTPQIGLGLAVSIKTINFKDLKTRRYTKNVKRVETRALEGFSRVEDGTRPVSLSLRGRLWLPAYRVQGEGIFLEFRRSFLDAWKSELGTALEKLLARDTRGRVPLPANPELVAIHTLAHLLILRLSFEAGYGSSSIRERLYVSPAGGATPMAGLLLYTAAGDADGTLGGLVRLGTPGFLERIFRNAIIDARWCSADPVCRESPGQGTDSLNLAACHACGLLPETSCETGNRLLDRLTIVGAGKEGRERPGLFRAIAWK